MESVPGNEMLVVVVSEKERDENVDEVSDTYSDLTIKVLFGRMRSANLQPRLKRCQLGRTVRNVGH